MQVLVVEDDEVCRRVLATALEDDFRTLQARNGAEALSLLTHTAVDAVLLDLMLPELDGVNLLRRLRRRGGRAARVPVLVLTGLETATQHIDALIAGADACLSKPFDPELLVDALLAVATSTPAERDVSRRLQIDTLKRAVYS